MALWTLSYGWYSDARFLCICSRDVDCLAFRDMDLLRGLRVPSERAVQCEEDLAYPEHHCWPVFEQLDLTVLTSRLTVQIPSLVLSLTRKLVGTSIVRWPLVSHSSLLHNM